MIFWSQALELRQILLNGIWMVLILSSDFDTFLDGIDTFEWFLTFSNDILILPSDTLDASTWTLADVHYTRPHSYNRPRLRQKLLNDIFEALDVFCWKESLIFDTESLISTRLYWWTRILDRGLRGGGYYQTHIPLSIGEIRLNKWDIWNWFSTHCLAQPRGG